LIVIYIGNIVENGGGNVVLIRNAIRDCDNANSTALIIPKEFAKALGIEKSGVSMSLLDDFSGNGRLVVSKHHREIVMD
jgi:hypothetical protein